MMKNSVLNTMIFIGIAALFVSVALSIAAKEDPSLVLYLSFDAVSGKEVKDESGKNNNGKIVGGPKFITASMEKRFK